MYSYQTLAARYPSRQLPSCTLAPSATAISTEYHHPKSGDHLKLLINNFSRCHTPFSSTENCPDRKPTGRKPILVGNIRQTQPVVIRFDGKMMYISGI
ncbi:hypothetical protein HanRHA438_Chr06g0274851 [Helianthus annuus]|nr:hypothetical protein HanRHA438_Chr06g0274851 [Helianthus annuus]